VSLFEQGDTVYGRGDLELNTGLEKKTLIPGERVHRGASDIDCSKGNAIDEFLIGEV
jgi:hypothetical protein